MKDNAMYTVSHRCIYFYLSEGNHSALTVAVVLLLDLFMDETGGIFIIMFPFYRFMQTQKAMGPLGQTHLSSNRIHSSCELISDYYFYS